MSILQQLIDYLSQPPDSIVYHVVTLLALQTTLGLSWWQFRRRSDDDLARRLIWASGIILLSRLLILLALFASSEVVDAIALLPPLERAIDGLTAAIMVWALAPQAKALPRLGGTLATIAIIVMAFLYIAFAAEWRTLVDSGIAYAETQQALVWSVLQLAILAVGGALIVYARESQWSLRLAILAVLLATQAASLLLGADYGPADVEVSFWARVGNVIAFPMLAVLAYRHNLGGFVPAVIHDHSIDQRLIRSIELASNLSASLQPAKTTEEALALVGEMVPARLVAVVQVDDNRPQHLRITAKTISPTEPGQTSQTSVRSWSIRRDHQSALARTLRDAQQREILSDGSGARQFHELRQEFKLAKKGAVLVQPLANTEKVIGLLLLAGHPSLDAWPEEDKAVVAALGPLVAHSLGNARRHQMALAGKALEFEDELASLKGDLTLVSRQRDEAVREASHLTEQLAVTHERLEVDSRKLRETTQALAMAVQRRSKVRQLEEELVGLREALAEAELALAYAAAGEAGLSTEWVMRTVTRYSGELEEAQAQIHALEERLKQPNGQELSEQTAVITGRLRTPLTALGGYTDLLLDSATGKLSPQQESLLRRMRVNVDNMTVTVNALAETARTVPASQSAAQLINVHEAIEEAIYAVSRDLQAKRLRVDVYLGDELPPLEDAASSLDELLVKLLSAACLAASPNGRLHIGARHITAHELSEGSSAPAGYLRLSISDDGGAHSHRLYAETLAPIGKPSKNGQELAQLLQSASLIAASQGGRSWLDLAHPKGGSLVLLLPVPRSAAGLSG